MDRLDTYQPNNIRERSSWVRLMTVIYCNVTAVISWLGPDETGELAVH